MSWQRSDRPAWVRALNAGLRGLAATGAPIARLDESSLLERAQQRARLLSFGDEGFREPLGILCRALDEEADLTPIGRLLARDELTGLLENRLRLTDTWIRCPEIEKREVKAPIFVTGSGRSGTSILHELLAQDPAHRVPLTWELLHPCPPPEAASADSDPRIARADREAKRWERIAPAYRTMHEMGARVPQECIYITAIDFRSDLLSGSYQVPSYAAWLARADMRPAYAYHRRVLQLLQWRHPGERWVLKAPSHLQSLPALLDVYPDARIVWTHRDPLQVMASMTSLLATLYWVRSDRIDAGAIARRWSRGVAHMLEIAMRQRDEGLIDDARIIDVQYRDLLDDPIAAIRRVYGHFDLELGAGTEARMRAYLAAKPQGRHGAHAYTFADTGLDLATERERFAAYQRRFEIPSEF